MNIENLSKMASSVKSFVDQVSSYEGAELSTDINGKSCSENGEINFDPNTFMVCVKNLLHCNDVENNSSSGCETDSFDDSDVDDDFVSCFKDGQVENELSQLMDMMDSELKDSNVTKSFGGTKTSNKPGGSSTSSIDAPLDLDYNVIENFLESFASQDGLPGPVSTLMQNFGLRLPPDDGAA